MALYMSLSAVVGTIYGALQNTSVHNWDENFIMNVSVCCSLLGSDYSMRPPEQLLETVYGPQALRNETVIVTGFNSLIFKNNLREILIHFMLMLVLRDFHLYMTE